MLDAFSSLPTSFLRVSCSVFNFGCSDLSFSYSVFKSSCSLFSFPYSVFKSPCSLSNFFMSYLVLDDSELELPDLASNFASAAFLFEISNASVS